MFSKLAVLLVSAAVLVSAVPGSYDPPSYNHPPPPSYEHPPPPSPNPPPPSPPPVVVTNKTVNKCNVGSLQCCKSVQRAGSAGAQKQAGILNIALGSVQGLVGFQCNPISVLGIGSGSNCNATPVCCERNKFNGLLAVGCTPINVNA